MSVVGFYGYACDKPFDILPAVYTHCMLLLVAFIIEMVHTLIGRLWNFQPLLTRAEVQYFSMMVFVFLSATARSAQRVLAVVILSVRLSVRL